ncbi:MAG: ATP/GTP-binding protein, partial [Gammaproteobacteria bacterium]
MDLPEPQGYIVRRKVTRARPHHGWYAPSAAAALTSTRQAEILNTALVAAPTDAQGIIVGRDRLSNALVAHDPFAAYERGDISSPAVVVLGVVGAGKSSLLKTVYVLRPLILRNRRVVVMDKKDRGGEGEYCELSRQFGAEPLRFVIGGGGTRLNILDPVILAGAKLAGQARLLIALAELANNGNPLDGWETDALRCAHKATLRQGELDGQVPLLEHLMHHLGMVSGVEYSDYSGPAKERMHQAGLGVRHLLSSMLSDELGGIFDGP